eukprot:TRINITY_DN2897_c0_g1_i9.p1 TRINITY_DN2897_c0_g1~~TRINITY_DN2897_c0_g1_i9.p1  ORF type:complete len:1159 (-),score=167.26 TRINITY_DN2897_c0_g1_i9:333-3809(-)
MCIRDRSKTAAAPTSCAHELVTCQAGGIFPQERCFPYLPATTTLQDPHLDRSPSGGNGWILPNGTEVWFDGYYAPLGNDDAWNTLPDYMIRCDCPEGRYGHDCSMVAPLKCPNDADWVWDGSFRNTLTPEKQFECFLKPAADQAGLANTITASMRHHRINITITNTTDPDALPSINVKFYSRFRPHNELANTTACPIWVRAYLPSPSICGMMTDKGWDPGCRDPVPADPSQGAFVGNPGHVYTGPPSSDWSGGEYGFECAKESVNWLSCSMSQCKVTCAANGETKYDCLAAQCGYEEPPYLNPGSSVVGPWGILKAVTAVPGQTGTLTFGSPVSFSEGTSNKTTLHLNFPGKTALDFEIQCMGGSCISREDIPADWNIPASQTSVTKNFQCNPAPTHSSTARRQGEVPAGIDISPPAPQPTSFSAEPAPSLAAADPALVPTQGPTPVFTSQRVLISIICASVIVFCLLYGSYIFFKAVILGRQFHPSQKEHESPSVESDDTYMPLEQHEMGFPPSEASQELPVFGPPIGLLVDQVSYSVSCQGKKKEIVQPLSAAIPAGAMVALLGPSGAGKSSLLDIMGGRNKVGTVKGNVCAFDNSGTRQRCKGVAYCMQHDYLLPTETVAETLMFAARIRGARVVRSESQIIFQVKLVLQLLQLTGVANSRIGSSITGGGLSGGERKRVSIGVELVSAPSLLVLDEPTSGLDSTSTQIVLDVLRKIADAGISTVFSVHQPPFQEFAKFDQILLMSRRGQMLYTGSPAGSVKYMNHLVQNWTGTESIPANVVGNWSSLTVSPSGFGGFAGNPAEHLLTVASLESDELLDEMHAFLLSNPLNWYEDNVHRPIEDVKLHCKPGALMTPHDSPGACSRMVGLQQLVERGVRFCVRNPALLLSQAMVVVVIGGFFAAFTPHLVLDFAGIQTRAYMFNFLILFLALCSTSSIGAIMSEKDVYIRERHSNTYMPEAYLLSKAFVDFIPLRIMPPIFLTYICYWRCGLRDDDTALFGKFMFTLAAGNCCSSSLSLLIASISPSVGTANLMVGTLILYNFVFSGLLLTGAGQTAMYVRYSSAFYYQWEALSGVEFRSAGASTATHECRSFVFNPSIGGVPYFKGNSAPLVCTEAMLENFKLHDRYSFDLGILLIFILGQLFLTALVLRFSRFKK